MPCGHDDEGKLARTHQRAGVIAAQSGFAALLCDPVDQGVFDILKAEAVRLEAVREPLTTAKVRQIAGIWENIPGAPRIATVRTSCSDGRLAVSDGIAYDRGVKDYWYTRGGPREEIAAMMSWRDSRRAGWTPDGSSVILRQT